MTPSDVVPEDGLASHTGTRLRSPGPACCLSTAAGSATADAIPTSCNSIIHTRPDMSSGVSQHDRIDASMRQTYALSHNSCRIALRRVDNAQAHRPYSESHTIGIAAQVT